MPDSKLTVVISAGQSRNPEKRQLENDVALAAGQMSGVEVLRIPHLYDLAKDGQTFKTLQAVTGDIVLITWLFTRAAHWILDRNGVQGQVGHVELVDEQEEGDEAQSQLENEEPRVADSRPRPDRQIFSLDFRVSSNPHDYSVEMQRIQQSLAMVEGVTTSQKLTLEMLTRFEQPTNDTYVGSSTAIPAEASEGGANLFGESSVRVIEEHPSRRWYPVIDFSRCTNCMECIDFCLFGVYGVDSLETIVVEQADNCRKGCPACSRVCPQNAIIFPQHKTPAIAGAPVDAGGLKIDLSKLFGAPDDGEDAAAAAIRERDEQLVLAGRQAVGTSTGISERLAERAVHLPEPDALDDLIDQLDSLDL